MGELGVRVESWPVSTVTTEACNACTDTLACINVDFDRRVLVLFYAFDWTSLLATLKTLCMRYLDSAQNILSVTRLVFNALHAIEIHSSIYTRHPAAGPGVALHH